MSQMVDYYQERARAPVVIKQLCCDYIQRQFLYEIEVNILHQKFCRIDLVMSSLVEIIGIHFIEILMGDRDIEYLNT